jgi:hypothetical protein
MNTMVSLTRRLQTIKDGEGNHRKYLLEKLYKQQAFDTAKILKKKGNFNLKVPGV